MLFFTFLLVFICFSRVLTSNQTNSTTTYIIKSLNSKNITCDLHDFIVKTDDSDNDYKVFLSDLNNFCSDTQSTEIYQLLCHMILIEFELACLLPNNSRPTPVKYTLPYTATKICSMNKINLTNVWIWEKLSIEEREEFASTPDLLCSAITVHEEMLLLAKFFYKIAPRIRRADLTNDINLNSINSSNQTQNDNIHVGWMEDMDLSLNNTTVIDSIGNVQPRTIKNTNQTIDLNGTEIENGKQDQLIEISTVNLDKVNKTQNESSRSEGLPLGRAGEKPEREQVNERPKPNVLDVESIFKLNENEKQNWVEGKNLPTNGDNSNFRLIKSDENLLAPSAFAKRKFPFRLKSSRQYDRDDEYWIDNYFSSFLIFVLCIIVVYIILHNKNKVLGLFIEGCRRRRMTSSYRSSHRHTRLSQSSK